MAPTYKLSTFSKVSLVTALVSVAALTVTGLFLVTDDSLVPHENSALVRQYAETGLGGDVTAEPVQFSPRYGQSEGTETLVLYDDQASHAEASEMYAIAAANLATHFGMVEINTLDEYQDGDLDSYDAAVYVGTDHTTAVPDSLVNDVREGTTDVLWVGENIADLAGPDGFVEQYGWDPTETQTVESADLDEVTYDAAVLNRYDGAETAKTVETPEIVDDQVEVVASARNSQSDSATHHPWVIRSGNLTHLVELPYHYIDHNELYLVYADLYFDLLGPEAESTQRAAVRIEDVNAESDPDQLRAVADYLYSEDVPFQVAVIPMMIDRTPDADAWYGMDLMDSPEVVEALKYMQEHGGTLIQHGTTHQYGAANNPYSGRTGDDYEFYAYGCSATETPPFDWEECQDDSWVRKMHPVPNDEVAEHRQRLDDGRQVMIEAGLGEPTIFETPHYTASVNAYQAMADSYDARYEQVEYYAGMLSGGEFDPQHSYGQIFPYTVHDIYGTTVYPENLQNPTEKEQNNHPARPPQTLIDRAEANLVVTDSTASFYYHPFLDIGYLEEIVEGVHELGYEFVPVTELD